MTKIKIMIGAGDAETAATATLVTAIMGQRLRASPPTTATKTVCGMRNKIWRAAGSRIPRIAKATEMLTTDTTPVTTAMSSNSVIARRSRRGICKHSAEPATDRVKGEKEWRG